MCLFNILHWLVFFQCIFIFTHYLNYSGFRYHISFTVFIIVNALMLNILYSHFIYNYEFINNKDGGKDHYYQVAWTGTKHN